MEQTFFMIKPDGVKRGFIGEVISRIERRGFSIDRLEVRYADADILKRHYAELTDRPFFPTLVDYMTSGPVIIGVISGEEVISTWRTMMGSTNPKDAFQELFEEILHKLPLQTKRHVILFMGQTHLNLQLAR